MRADILKYVAVALGAAVVVLSIILWAVLSDRADLGRHLVESNEKVEALRAHNDTLRAALAFEAGVRQSLQQRIDANKAQEATNQNKRDEIRNPSRPRITRADDLRGAILRSVRKGGVLHDR